MRGDSTFQTVNTDLVSDTSPQLGGNLDVNTKNIVFGDSGGATDDRLTFGAGTDLSIYHDGSNSRIHSPSHSLFIRTGSVAGFFNGDGTEDILKGTVNGAVELYYDNSKKLETTTNGIAVTGQMYGNSGMIVGAAGGDSALELYSDAGGQDADKIRIRQTHVGNSFLIESYASGAYQSILKGTDARTIELHYQGTKKFETTSAGVNVEGNIIIDHTGGTDGKGEIAFGESGRPFIDGFDNGNHGSGAGFDFRAGNGDYFIKTRQDAAVELYYDNSKKIETTSSGIKSQGTGQVNIIAGSTNAGGAYLILDGDSNGDASGSDYASLGHKTSGALELRNYKDNSIDFLTNNSIRWYIYNTGHFIPAANNTYDIGSTSYRVRNIYTNDLQLSNKGSTNSVDNTWGDYTIQEGESDLFLINNRSGKKYKFNLTEVS